MYSLYLSDAACSRLQLLQLKQLRPYTQLEVAGMIPALLRSTDLFELFWGGTASLATEEETQAELGAAIDADDNGDDDDDVDDDVFLINENLSRFT